MATKESSAQSPEAEAPQVQAAPKVTGTPTSIPVPDMFVGQTPGWDVNAISETANAQAEQRAALFRPRTAPSENLAPKNSGEGDSIPKEEKVAKIDEGTVRNPIPERHEGPTYDYTVKAEDIDQISDPIVKSMALMFRNAAKGADLDRALGNAIRYADSRLIDSAYLREIGGDNAEDLIAMAKGIVEGVVQQAQRFEQSVYAEAGGEKAWYQAVNIFNAKAPEELRITVANMIDSQNEKLIRAATRMVVNFNNNSGFAPVVKEGLRSSPVSQAPQGMSEADFDKAIRGLNMFSRDFAQKRDELIRQRKLGIQAGL